jgi:hypothetical protein
MVGAAATGPGAEIRDLLLSLAPNHDPTTYQLPTALPAGRDSNNSNGNIKASSSKAPHRIVGVALGRPGDVAPSRREQEIAKRLSILKRLPGGFPAFNDARPAPGCEYELAEYRQAVDPFFHPDLGKQVSQVYLPADIFMFLCNTCMYMVFRVHRTLSECSNRNAWPACI